VQLAILALTPHNLAFGPEVGVAINIRSKQYKRPYDLYICKHGVGSTYIAPYSTGYAGGITKSWNSSETTMNGCYHSMLKSFYTIEQRMRLEGIGPNFMGIAFFIGLNDGTSTTYAPDQATYQGYLQSFYTQLQTDTSLTNPVCWLPEANINATGSNATAIANVRAAQLAFASANTPYVTCPNVDSYALEADGIHFNGASNIAFGPLITSALGL
jgi:hypothetical protein